MQAATMTLFAIAIQVCIFRFVLGRQSKRAGMGFQYMSGIKAKLQSNTSND